MFSLLNYATFAAVYIHISGIVLDWRITMLLSSPIPRHWHPSIRIQLMLASALICAILTGILALALTGLAYLRTETQHAIAVVGVKSQLADDVAIATLLCRRYEKDILLNVNQPSVRATYLKQWQAAYTDLQQTIEQYAVLASSDAEQQQVELWRNESSTYRRAVLDVEQAIANGTLTTSPDANAALTPFKDSIRKLTDSAQKQADDDGLVLQQANVRLTTITDQFFQILIGLGIIALALTIGWSILFPSRLLKPIAALQQVTQRFTHGELSARADLVRTDEIGSLANSFNQMAQRISQQLIELDQSALVQQQNEQLRALLDMVRDLEIPAIPLIDHVLLIPLVGHFDTRRMLLIQEHTLKIIHAQHTRTIILDLSGISMLDTSVTHALEQFTAAANLLGTHTIVTGINAQVSQAITHLGVRFEHVHIAAHVQEAITSVLQARRNSQ